MYFPAPRHRAAACLETRSRGTQQHHRHAEHEAEEDAAGDHHALARTQHVVRLWWQGLVDHAECILLGDVRQHAFVDLAGDESADGGARVRDRGLAELTLQEPQRGVGLGDGARAHLGVQAPHYVVGPRGREFAVLPVDPQRDEAGLLVLAERPDLHVEVLERIAHGRHLGVRLPGLALCIPAVRIELGQQVIGDDERLGELARAQHRQRLLGRTTTTSHADPGERREAAERPEGGN